MKELLEELKTQLSKARYYWVNDYTKGQKHMLEEIISVVEAKLAQPLEPQAEGECNLCINCPAYCQCKCHSKAPKELPDIEGLAPEPVDADKWSDTHMRMFNKINQLVERFNTLSKKK